MFDQFLDTNERLARLEKRLDNVQERISEMMGHRSVNLHEELDDQALWIAKLEDRNKNQYDLIRKLQAENKSLKKSKERNIDRIKSKNTIIESYQAVNKEQASVIRDLRAENEGLKKMLKGIWVSS